MPKKWIFVNFFIVLLMIISAVRAGGAGLLNKAGDQDSLPSWERKFKDFRFSEFIKGGHQLPYRWYEPIPKRKTEKYPLVIFFHGAGERGIDNRKQFMRFTTVPFWLDHPCYIIAPQCPTPQQSGPHQGTWVDTPFGARSNTMKKEPTWPMAMAIELIDRFIKKNRSHIDTNRIYVTGLSMGGFATWEILQRCPDKFAAAIPVSGGADINYAERMKNIPIWVFHGGQDSVVLTRRSRDIVHALKDLGDNPRYTELPGVGHSAWEYTYRSSDVWNWLFLQSK